MSLLTKYDHVFLCSGGVDSAYLTLTRRPRYESGLALFVNYQQPAAKKERAAAKMMAKSGKCEFAEVVVSGLPLGDMIEGSIGPCVVPARNLWLISLAAAFGTQIWIGCAPQDERDYEDCRLEFLSAGDLHLQTLGKRLNWSQDSRQTRIDKLTELNLIDYVWSCYGPGNPGPCGECASCKQ